MSTTNDTPDLRPTPAVPTADEFLHLIPEAKRPRFAALTLSHGAHDDPAHGLCAMEAAAWLAGEPHSDRPQCVSPVIGAFLRAWNDVLPEPPRTALLRPLIPLTLGTATGPADDKTRAWLATDWLCRVQTPAWLRLAGLTHEAEALEACARIVDAVTARAAQPHLDTARERSAAAWAAAGAAARAAAWDAAGAAARVAAWAAARVAAWDAAWDAARDAAWDAAWAAAAAAAGDAARAAAWDAAGAAVGDAAAAAADGALAPTVAQLQASACELVRAMCAVGRTEAR